MNYLKLNKEPILYSLFFCFIIFLGFWDIKLLFPISILIILKFFFKTKFDFFNFSLLDLGFVILFLGEIVTTLKSSYTYNSLNSFTFTTIIIVLYLGYRNIFRKKKKRELFTLIFSFYCLTLLAGTILFFIYFYSTTKSQGFFDLNNFKNLYNPFKIFNNLWVSNIILFIPFNLLSLISSKKNKLLITLNLFLIIFCVIASFSRGAYLSLFLYIFLFNAFAIRLTSKKFLFIFNGGCLIFLFLSSFFLKDSFLTTLSFNKTVSQNRSISGRIDSWEHTLGVIDDKMFTGWGQNNYALSQSKKPYLLEDKSFSSMANNTYIQLFIERGLLGIIYYSIFLLFIFYLTFKGLKSKKNSKKKKIELIIIFSGFSAFLLRELTFSSFLSHNTVSFLLFHLVFFLIPYDISLKTIKVDSSKRKTLSTLCLTLILGLCYLNGKRMLVKKYNNNFIKFYYSNDYTSSLKLINKSLKLTPNNIILNKQKATLIARETFKIKISHEYKDMLLFNDFNVDSLNISKKCLLNVIRINPYDDESIHNLGWISFANKEKQSAKDYFDKSLQLDPYNSIYHISKALYDLKYSNLSNALFHIKAALKYSPEILESILFEELSKRFGDSINKIKNEAIKDLEANYTINHSPIIKARLARLLLDKNPKKALDLLKETNISLPNMNRPWLYRAYLNIKEGDTLAAERNYKKALFLDKNDFLSILYNEKYFQNHKDIKNANSLKELLKLYRYIQTPSYDKNGNLSDLRIISNTYIPNTLLYYVKADINPIHIFKSLEKYYNELEDFKTMEKYKVLSDKYRTELYVGE